MRTETEIINEINRLEDDAKNAIAKDSEDVALWLYSKINILKWILESPDIIRHIARYTGYDDLYDLPKGFNAPTAMCKNCYDSLHIINRIPMDKELYYDTDPESEHWVTQYYCPVCAYELAEDLNIFKKIINKK